ncbi:STAS domain-containing protein [Streptomyces sp. T-3]|nr:STAS domain-containing protein [Streptomyces sp. T-3]
MATEHSVHLAPSGAYRVVRADGELDLATVGEFAQRLHDVESLGPWYAARLVVDLSAVTFMDGSALPPLIAAQEHSVRQGGWTRVVYTRRGISMLFRVAGLMDSFPRYATVADAWQDIVSHSL